MDFEKLPKCFSQTVEVFQVSFDMVLVPGDEARGIKPLYFGRKEVTWDEFLPWVYGKDVLPDTEEAVRLRVQRLRPSLPYGDITRGYGEKGYSALSMSRRSAELYCEWMSKQTGRKYRLPSEKEWEHLCRLGRRGKDGEPDEEEAKSTAVYKDTAWSQDAGELRPKPGGSKKPDALGLYDVMGNLAEWVTATGGDHVVRGGHFKSPRAELGQAGRLLEEDGSWDVEYAGAIKSLWWFVDANWVGFRLVCEP
ncbi:MAG: SUMF1/EgtB/PvdO family nonheme iron enzyme [Kiritimatiellia bacterium]